MLGLWHIRVAAQYYDTIRNTDLYRLSEDSYQYSEHWA